MDEATITAGAVAVDASGNGKHGTYRSELTTSVAGLFAGSNRAIKFPIGTGRFGVSLPYFLRPSASQKFAIVGFIDIPAVDSTARQILSADDTGDPRTWQFRLRNGRLEFVTIIPVVTTTTSASVLAAGSRHFVGLVFDPTALAIDGVVKIYIDGALDAKSAASITVGTLGVNAAIGNQSGSTSGAGNYQGGTIDNCALWYGNVPTAAEMAALWAARDA